MPRKFKAKQRQMVTLVDGQTALGHHLFQIPVAEGISQIPPHAEKDYPSWKCRPRNSAGRFWLTESP